MEEILSNSKPSEQTERTTLVCETHGFTGGLLTGPTQGCEKCAFVQIFNMVARKKGDKYDALAQVEDIVHALCELEDEGILDYTTTKPQIHIEKDAIKD